MLEDTVEISLSKSVYWKTKKRSDGIRKEKLSEKFPQTILIIVTNNFIKVF